MTAYARGRYAWGICDRCSFQYPLDELRFQTINRVRTSLRVCKACLDIDHEQLRIGDIPRLDPEILRDARPDTGEATSRSLAGWAPVRGMEIASRLGRVGV